MGIHAMPRIVAGAIVVLLIGCGSESFTEVEAQRTELIGGFVSYATRAEVMAKLSRAVEIKVVEDTSLGRQLGAAV